MIIIIPNEFKKAINEMPYNKTVKINSIKIYAALYLKRYLKNSVGYFPVSSQYLQSINKRYYNIMEYFISKGLIDYYKRAVQDDKDIFKTKYTKYYDTERGICTKYRFLVNTEIGDEINVDMITNKKNRWHKIIEDSLIETGFEVKITRDSFGRRVHHSAIKEYKKDFKGYYTVDSVCSQPRLLYLYLKERNIIDNEYNNIFENDKDFYSEISYKLNLESRNDAKELFMFWLNGNGYVPKFTIHILFPNISKYLKKLKKGNYKNSSSLLQRIESKIWIDDILNNIPCDFALPIHDAVIVKEADVDKVLNFCIGKYPDLKFKKEIIK